MKYNPIVTSPKKMRQVLNIQNNFNLEDLANVSGYEVSDILGRSRTADIAEWRQIIQTYMRGQEYTLEQIGAMTNRKHDTVVYSCKSVCDRLKVHDKRMTKKVNKLRNAINKPNIDITFIAESLLSLQNQLNTNKQI